MYGSTTNFDLDFNPLNDHTKKRWLSVAAARLQGKNLPPVSMSDLFMGSELSFSFPHKQRKFGFER